MALLHVCTHWLRVSDMFLESELLMSDMKVNKIACVPEIVSFPVNLLFLFEYSIAFKNPKSSFEFTSSVNISEFRPQILQLIQIFMPQLGFTLPSLNYPTQGFYQEQDTVCFSFLTIKLISSQQLNMYVQR